MAAKITLLQEDINLLAVDAIVSCQFSSMEKSTGTGVASISRPAGAPWQANKMLLVKIASSSQCSEDTLTNIAGAYNQAFALADNSDIRSVAFTVIGAHEKSVKLADGARKQLCEMAIRSVSEASATYGDLRKIIVCASDEQEYEYLLLALQTLQLH